MKTSEIKVSILGFISILLLFISVQGCNFHLKVEKRKHRSGFNIEFTKTKISESQFPENKGKDENRTLSRSLQTKENSDSETIQEQKEVNNLQDQPIEAIDQTKVNLSYNDSVQDIQLKEYDKSVAGDTFKSVEGTPKNSNHSQVTTFLLIILFGSVLGIALKNIFRFGSKEHAAYAKDNPKKIRRRITGIHLFSGFSSFVLALLHKNTEINTTAFSVISVLFVLISIVSHWINEKFNNQKNSRNVIRKANIFAMMFGGGLGLFTLFHSGILSSFTTSAHHFANVSDGDNAGNVLLTIVIIAVDIFLWYLLAVWACNLSCSGYLIASYWVIYGGTFLLVFLSLLLILKLFFVLETDEELNKEKRKRNVFISLGVAAIIDLILLFIGAFN